MPPAVAIPAMVAGSMLLSYVAQQFAQKPMKPGDRGFDIIPTDTRRHIPLIYGKHIIGAHRIFTRTHPNHKNILYVVYDLCMGEIESIDRILFDEEVVADFIGSPNDPIEAKWKGNVNIARRTGKEVEKIYSELTEVFGEEVWPSTSRGSGVASILLVLTKDSRGTGGASELFPGGLPNVKVRVRGKKVQDIRKDEIVETCQDVWTSNHAGVTVSLGTGRVNTNSVKLTLIDSISANTLLAYESFGAIDLSDYNALTFWIKSDVDLNAGDLQVLLDESTIPTFPKRTMDIPPLSADKWRRVVVNFDDTEDLASEMSAIRSIGIKQVNDIGVAVIEIDNVRATAYGYEYRSGKTLIDECNSAWSEQPNVTGVTRETTTGRTGNGTAARVSVKANNNTSAGTILMSKYFDPPLNLSTAKKISFWIRSNVEIKKGDLRLVLDDNALCSSPLENLKIPKLVLDKNGNGIWTKIELPFEDQTALTAIRSIGIKQHVNISKRTKQDAEGNEVESSGVGFKIDLDSVFAIEYTSIGTNPALCDADYLMSPIYGVGCDPSELKTQYFIDEANFYDEMVSGVPISPPKSPKAKLIDKKYGKLTAKSRYRYKLVYVQRNGTYTEAGKRSSWVDTKEEKRAIKIHNIQTSPHPDTIRIDIYRTKANGTKYYFVDSIDNETEFYEDDHIGDSELGSLAPEIGNASSSSQRRFTCNGIIDTSKTVQSNLEDLLTASRGNIFYESGQYHLFTRKSTLPETEIELFDDDLIGDVSVIFPGSDDTANVIKATWQNRHKKYQPVPIYWPLYSDTNPYLKQDNDLELMKELNLVFTDDEQMARQIQMVTLKEIRNKIKVIVRAKEKALKLKTMNVVNLTYQVAGWESVPFWVDSVGFSNDGNFVLALTAYEDTDYDYETLTKILPEDEDADDNVVDKPTERDILNDPPPVVGLRPLGIRGTTEVYQGRNFKWTWEAVTNIADNTGLSDDETYKKSLTKSQEGIKYKCEIFFWAIPETVVLGGINANQKVAFTKTITDTEFEFTYEQNIEATKEMFKPYTSNKYFNMYYGVAQRDVALRVTVVTEYNKQSEARESFVINPAPDMKVQIPDGSFVNQTPELIPLKNSFEVGIKHPTEEYDISHFLVKVVEAYVAGGESYGIEIFTEAIKWAPEISVPANKLIFPTRANGHVYRVLSNGKTGKVEPTWPKPSRGSPHPQVTKDGITYKHNSIYRLINIPSIINIDSSDDEMYSAEYKIVVDKVDPKTKYTVAVDPYDVYGKGSPSLYAEVTPGLTFDDNEDSIKAPATPQNLTVALTTPTSRDLRISWDAPSEIDLRTGIIEVRYVNKADATIQPTISEIAAGEISTGEICKATACYISIKDGQAFPHEFIFTGAMTGWKYFFRLQFINNAEQSSEWSHGESDMWISHAGTISGITTEDFDYSYKFFTYPTFTVTDADTVAWPSGTLKFLKSDTTTENYSIVSGNTGNMTGDGGWVVWPGDAPNANTKFKYVTTRTASQTAIARVKPDTNKAFLAMYADSKEFKLARSMISAGIIIGDHIEGNTLSAIKAVLGTLTMSDTDGSWIKMKNTAGDVTLMITTVAGGRPRILIMKDGYDADTVDADDPNKILFDSNNSYFKILDEGTYEIPNTSAWQDKTQAAGTNGYYGTVWIEGDKAPYGTTERIVMAMIYSGTGSEGPAEALVHGSTADSNDVCYQYVQASFRAVDLGGGTKGYIRLDRVCVNPMGSDKTLPSIVGNTIKWYLLADTLT